MSKEDRPSSVKKGDIVALLDGELSKDQASELKQRLGKDRRLRREVDLLKQTWKLLDHLETPETDGNFTQNTVGLALQKSEDANKNEAEARAVPSPKKREPQPTKALSEAAVASRSNSLVPVLVWCLAFVCCFVASFSIAATWSSRNDRVIRELPVIERLDEYRSIGNIEFLKLLHEKQLLEIDDGDIPDRSDAAETTS